MMSNSSRFEQQQFHFCINSSSIFEAQQQQQQENSRYIWLWVQILFYSLTFFIGTVGNLLVIFVILMNTKLKTVTNMYLLHLAITDVIYLQCIPFTIVTLIKQQWVFNIVACKLFWIFTGINQFTSIFILAVLAFDRYLAVCLPHQAINWRKVASSRIILFVVWLISILFMMPVILFSDVDRFPPPMEMMSNHSSNDTPPSAVSIENTSCISNPNFLPRPTCTIKWPENQVIQTEVAFIIYGIIISFFIPVILISIFYICVVKRLKELQFKLKHQSSEKDRARRKVTTLVLSVIGVYLITYTPYWINQIVLIIYYSLVEAPSEIFHHITTILSTLFQFLLYANSALNPYLYAFLSEAFRESFKKVFQCLALRLLCKRDELYFDDKNNQNSRKTNNANGSPNKSIVLPNMINADEKESLKKEYQLQSVYNHSIVESSDCDDVAARRNKRSTRSRSSRFSMKKSSKYDNSDMMVLEEGASGVPPSVKFETGSVFVNENEIRNKKSSQF